ncbi:MAG TPA: serine/threonine-protein kinase [Lachnospiraceae bacterium]|nr:serine/threonine-protein kinase [Lachnospiraceae bacterium]
MDFSELCAKYSNVALLARGGQKVVFSAIHKIYGDVVLKLYFHPSDPRTQREIDISSKFQFDSVPKIYETGSVRYEQSDTIFSVEERIVGIELRKRFDSGVRFTLADAVSFLEQGLKFICQLEKNDIVHRDIKPENIILTPEGKIYFIDFGIARMLDLPSLTKTEAIMGPHTPGYAAPEQFNNLKDSIDSRADIFSLGVVTYEGLTGKNPFRENAKSSLDILQNTETITPVAFCAEGDSQKQFMSLLSSMMGKYPSRRPVNAEQALGWLQAAKSTLSL